MNKTVIYLDNAATTRLSNKAFEAMLPFLKDSYGNPRGIYSLGREASIAVTNARRTVADCLGCKQREVFFTSGGSESNNWAIKSAARLATENGKRHIISCAIEHHSVLNVLHSLEKDGFEVTYLPVYEKGIVRPDDLEAAIRPDTGLATVMFANNETGTIQPIGEIGEICRKRGVLFHTDAVQAAGNLEIDVKKLNIDLLSLSAHKLHGPKGVGALYCTEKLPLPSFVHGGGQERGRRAGTENVAGVVGLAAAMEETVGGLAEKQLRLKAFQNRLIEEIGRISGAHLNGDREKRLCSNVNFSFEGIEGEALLLQLDLRGIAASSGSACTSGSLEPSHVLLAMGQKPELAKGSLRLTMSDETTQKDIDGLLEALPEIIAKLRNL